MMLVAIPSNRVNVSYGDNVYLIPRHNNKKVAIPSNRVNVSYGGTFPVCLCVFKGVCRNPLKSGQCFLLNCQLFKERRKVKMSRNPLKSGQCFLQVWVEDKEKE